MSHGDPSAGAVCGHSAGAPALPPAPAVAPPLPEIPATPPVATDPPLPPLFVPALEPPVLPALPPVATYVPPSELPQALAQATSEKRRTESLTIRGSIPRATKPWDYSSPLSQWQVPVTPPSSSATHMHGP